MKKLVKIEIGEWLAYGHFIQYQDHPALQYKYVTFPAVEHSCYCRGFNTFKEAVAHCKDNEIENPDYTPEFYGF